MCLVVVGQKLDVLKYIDVRLQQITTEQAFIRSQAAMMTDVLRRLDERTERAAVKSSEAH